jgi:hypothetical protein
MNQVSPCLYCGHIGYHVWAGGGGCPGAVPERERDAVASVYLQTLSEQNRRLSFALGRYVELCARAADALDKYGLSDDQKDLIAKLRKAAG